MRGQGKLISHGLLIGFEVLMQSVRVVWQFGCRLSVRSDLGLLLWLSCSGLLANQCLKLRVLVQILFLLLELDFKLL